MSPYIILINGMDDFVNNKLRFEINVTMSYETYIENKLPLIALLHFGILMR